MEKTQTKVLKALMEDGRATDVDIAKRLKVTHVAVAKHRQNLVDSGEIVGFRAVPKEDDLTPEQYDYLNECMGRLLELKEESYEKYMTACIALESIENRVKTYRQTKKKK